MIKCHVAQNRLLFVEVYFKDPFNCMYLQEIMKQALNSTLKFIQKLTKQFYKLRQLKHNFMRKNVN